MSENEVGHLGIPYLMSTACYPTPILFRVSHLERGNDLFLKERSLGLNEIIQGIVPMRVTLVSCVGHGYALHLLTG